MTENFPHEINDVPQLPGRTGLTLAASLPMQHAEEKETLRQHYQLTDTQLANYYRRAIRLPGRPVENLAHLLELRIDNVVYRAGFAKDIGEARKLVQHGYFAINDRKVRTPACHLRPGDRVSAKISATSMTADHQVRLPSYLQRVPGIQDTFECTSNPLVTDIPVLFDTGSLSEHYAKSA